MPKFEVVESITIDADLAKVRGLVRDFKQWEAWSPWLSAEPECKPSYDADGDGYSWDGSIIGSGKMRISGEDDASIQSDLNFFKPWKSHADIEFRFRDQGGKTQVDWSMKSSLPFFMFWMRGMMEAMIASDYQRGLSKLKDLAESGSVPSELDFVGVGEGLSTHYVGIRGEARMSDLAGEMEKRFTRLGSWLAEQELTPSGTPFSLYHKFAMAKGTTDFTAAIPVSAAPASVPADITNAQVNIAKSYKVKHTGAYRHLGSAWSAGMMHQRSKLFRVDKGQPCLEHYVNDPDDTPEAQLVTEIHFPAKG